MLLIKSKHKFLSEKIVEELANTPYQSVPELFLNIMGQGNTLTKQALYSALVDLKKNEVISVLKKKYFVNSIWVQKLENFSKLLSEKNRLREKVFSLKQSEYLSFSFNSLLEWNTYSAHIFILMCKVHQTNKPLLNWMHHAWFVIGRRQIEERIQKENFRSGIIFNFAVGGKTDLDHDFKKSYQNQKYRISLARKTFPEHKYLFVSGDFIIEVTISKQLAGDIDEFYKKVKTYSITAEEEFQKILTKKSIIKMKIYNDEKKARAIETKFKKIFLSKEIA